MNEPYQVAPNVWLLQDDETARNSALVTATEGTMLIDAEPARDLAPFEQRVARDLAPILAVIRTQATGATLPELPGAMITSPSTVEGAEEDRALPLPGWVLLRFSSPTVVGVYNAKARILFSGPILSGKDIPALPNGSNPYLADLELIEGLDAKLVVPSHAAPLLGKRDIRQRVERDRNYITALLRHVQTTFIANVSEERALQVARSIYEDYPFVEAHLDNVRSVWHELVTRTED